MMQVLDKYDLKEKVPLTDFLEALRKRESGYSWRDLVPDGVSHVAWYLLYDAYEEDERTNHAKRSAEVERIERERITDIRGGHIEF